MFTAEQRNLLLLFIVAKQVVPVLLQFVARVQVVVAKKKLNSLSCIFRWRNGEEERRTMRRTVVSTSINAEC